MSFRKIFDDLLGDTTKEKDKKIASSNIPASENSYIEIISQQPDMVEEKKNVEKNDEESQAEKIYKKWMHHFKVLSNINLEELSKKEIGRFYEEFNKKQDEVNQDKDNYFFNKQNAYIQSLYAEIDKKFNAEHLPKVQQIQKIEASFRLNDRINEASFRLNELLNDIKGIVPSRNKMLIKLINNDGKVLNYNINLSVKEIRDNFIAPIILNNEQLNTELKFSKYIYNRKNEVERLKTTYGSFKSSIADIIEEKSIKTLITSIDSIYASFDNLTTLIKETKDIIEKNKKIIIKYQSQLEIFEKIQTVYQQANLVLQKRKIEYDLLQENHNRETVNFAKVSGNMTWNEMFDSKEKLKASIKVENNYLDDFQNFYAFRTAYKNNKTLEERTNQLNNQSSQIVLDEDSIKAIKQIDYLYAILKNDVQQNIGNSQQKLQNLRSQSNELKNLMIDLENMHLLKGEYDQVRYLKFKAIKDHILEHEYFDKLKSYGMKEGSIKQTEISKYISKIENAKNLRVLFDAIKCDLKLKTKSYTMRDNIPSGSCFIGTYGLFHQGKCKTDDYAKSLESDLINFTKGIKEFSSNEVPLRRSAPR